MRLIDADAIQISPDLLYKASVRRVLAQAPAVDAAPVVHGRWALGHVEPGCCTPGGNRPWICSECGYLASWRLDRPVHKYCPNCGAKMDLEEEK